jgi:hypothetical protein
MADAHVDPNIEKLKALFIPHDPQQTGTIPSTHFASILAASGFTLNARLVSNLSGVVDPWGQGLSFSTFLWLHGLLTHAQAVFAANGGQGGSAPTANLGAILPAIGYTLPPTTVSVLY